MLQLMMYSRVMATVVNPQALILVRAMLSRRGTTPQATMATTGFTIRCDNRRNPIGAKLDTAAITPRRFERAAVRANGPPVVF
jgi:hypothetical protein